MCVCVWCVYMGVCLFASGRNAAPHNFLLMPLADCCQCQSLSYSHVFFLWSFFLFPSASFCYRQQNWEDLYIQHSCCARGPRRGKPTRIKLFRLWRSLFVVVAHNNSQRNKTFPDLVRVTEGGAKSFFLFVTLGGVAERRAKNINLHGWEWLAYRDNSPSSLPPSTETKRCHSLSQIEIDRVVSHDAQRPPLTQRHLFLFHHSMYIYR